MITTTISDFKKNLKRYIDSVIDNNEPVLVKCGKKGAVIVSLDKYNELVRTASAPTSDIGPFAGPKSIFNIGA